MLMYYQYHPLKNMPSALMSIGHKLRKHRPELLGGATGLAYGAYLGNQAFNNALPPVRELPHLDQANFIEVGY